MRRGRPPVRGAVALLVLALVAVAFAAEDPREHRRASTHSQAPPETPARLLALRAADPGGGAPWGIRLLSTRSGLLCAQVGRVRDGSIGQLGVDGAFNNDARLHGFPRGELSEVTATGTVLGQNAECVAPKETVSAVIDGLDRNAIDNPEGKTTIPLADRREIAYGLLGPHALAIAYKEGTKTVDRPVLRGLGAYIVVRAARHTRALGTSAAAPGSDYNDDLAPAAPAGFIRAITYRYGKTVCRDDGHEAVVRCHLPNYPLGSERTPSQNGR